MSDKEYNAGSWRQEDVARLKELIREGCAVNQEIDDLKTGLSETVKAIAEEMQIKPGILNKAIKVASKASLQEERDKMTELEDILDAVGRGL